MPRTFRCRAAFAFVFALAVAATAGCSDKSELADLVDQPAETPQQPSDRAAAPPPPPPPPPPPAVEEPAEEPVEPEPQPEVEPEPSGDPLAAEHPLEPDEARAAVEKLGGRVSVDESGNVVKVFFNRTDLGDDRLWVVKYLPQLEILNLTGTRIGDDGLEQLAELANLKRIYAADTPITDDGVAKLKTSLAECDVLR